MNIPKLILSAIVSGSIGICFSCLPSLAKSDNISNKTCRVTDPTGSPLNIRLKPNGKIVARIRNQRIVYPQSIIRDDNGKKWTLIAIEENNKPLVLGWALREFISCY
jgi:hypothetical protein